MYGLDLVRVVAAVVQQRAGNRMVITDQVQSRSRKPTVHKVTQFLQLRLLTGLQGRQRLVLCGQLLVEHGIATRKGRAGSGQSRHGQAAHDGCRAQHRDSGFGIRGHGQESLESRGRLPEDVEQRQDVQARQADSALWVRQGHVRPATV
ncbi:hypothetical protein DMA10_34385 [Streptomyces sp. WAC 01420]|nr:hypothetical protein DLM49_34820 [Streptomyces sp. WAC 01438]RSM88149.1 hypothetical protein DMA10_34385 [Streptomyces sp. WAC 01420]